VTPFERGLRFRLAHPEAPSCAPPATSVSLDLNRDPAPLPGGGACLKDNQSTSQPAPLNRTTNVLDE
jgi:hypothetical protein